MQRCIILLGTKWENGGVLKVFNIILLGLVSLFTDISSEMVYPLLPLYLTNRLGAGPAVLGVIEGIAESLASLLKVGAGYITDKTKKPKMFTIFGYVSSSLSRIVLYLSTSWLWVLGARIIDRFGKGIRTAPRDVLILENAGEKGRGTAFGLHRALDTLGAVIGIILAYFLLTGYNGDYLKVFIISLIPAFLGVVCLFFVREKKEARFRSNHLSLKWSALDKRLKIFLLITFIFALGNSSNQFLLLKAQGVGFTADKVILLYLVYNLVYALTSFPAGKLSDKIGRKSFLVGGYFFYGLVYLGFAMVKSSSAVWLLFGIYGLYTGLTEGVEKALIGDIASLELRGTAIGLHAALVGLGLLPASFLAGWLWSGWGSSAPFYFGSFTGFCAALALLISPIYQEARSR
jgi:MFS family permease